MTSQSDLRRAYSTCIRLVRDHYENFPVASRLLPASIRPHIAAVYAFARVADDFADEGERTVQERLELLDCWGRRLAGIQGSTLNRTCSAHVEHCDADDIFLALENTIDTHELPVELFNDLLSAFRQDVTVTRYASWADLLDYCRRSANPVGRIVLRISGVGDVTLDQRSDSVCSALQITNLLQDFGRDWRAGRLYVPDDIQQECGAKISDLKSDSITPAWNVALKRCAERARELFLDGRPVCDGVTGRLMMELRLTWLGGMRILDRVERTRYDPLNDRPTLGFGDALPLVWRAVVWT